MASFQLPIVHCRQLRVISRRQFGGLDEDRLQVLVTLLGDRPAALLARRIVLRLVSPQ
jgi:hypothetical protein